MARTIKSLIERQVRNAKPQDKLFDGGGLFVEVAPSGSRIWRSKFQQSNVVSDNYLGRLCRLNKKRYPMTFINCINCINCINRLYCWC